MIPIEKYNLPALVALHTSKSREGIELHEPLFHNGEFLDILFA
jgi:hypothetical protein